MTRIFKYEYDKVRSNLNYIYFIIILTQVFSLSFFALVGAFEVKDVNSILQSSRGISILATTFNISIVTIYLTLFTNKFLLGKYIKNTKERMYMFPDSKVIFATKLKAIILRYSLLFLPIVFTINFIFNIAINFISSFEFISPFISAFSVAIFSLLISIFILLVSLMFGLKFQSKNSFLISSIIIVAISGNFVATTFFITSFQTLLISAFIIVIDYIVYKHLIKMLDIY